MKDDCIFCKLANNVYPTNSIYEDDLFNVILDAGPASKGHALVIPKEHYANLYEMPDDLLQKAIVLAKKMAVRMTDKLNCDGFNLVQNNGETAGQTVFHFHIHLIPRYKEGSPMIHWNQESPSPEELSQIRDLLV
ncbi:HIT family protein [bacterium C-53]|nr:HIT family protein [Lachnospiraceae bacterium]NBI03048.1 HIT family protein [Lachnospiraceae bacterium]RKJ10658.1 HIT family protein [bacterium C-53]